MLRQHALVDDQVGTVPSDLWGQGKLRVYRSLFGVDPLANDPPRAGITLPVAPIYAGEPATFTPELQDAEDPVSALQVRWDEGYDGSFAGPFAAPEPWVMTFAQPGTHRLKLEVRDTAGLTAAAAVLFEVLDPALRPDVGALMDAGADGLSGQDGRVDQGGGGAPKEDEGCSCRAAAGDQAGRLGLLGLLLLIAFFGRRRAPRRSR